MILRINRRIDLQLQGKTHVHSWRASLFIAVEGSAGVRLARFDEELAHRVLVDAAKSHGGSTRSTSRQTTSDWEVYIDRLRQQQARFYSCAAKHSRFGHTIEREKQRGEAERPMRSRRKVSRNVGRNFSLGVHQY